MVLLPKSSYIEQAEMTKDTVRVNGSSSDLWPVFHLYTTTCDSSPAFFPNTTRSIMESARSILRALAFYKCNW